MTTAEPTAKGILAYPMSLLRRIYDWVLHWAVTPYGALALFILAAAESSFFPIPPDVLLIALAIGYRAKALWFALVCSLGSVIGGAIGYGIGYALWQPEVAEIFYRYIPGFTEQVFERVKDTYQEYDFWFVFAAGFTPIPYKVFTISGGVCHINFPMFLVASMLSRSARFFLVAGLIYKFGAPIKSFIDKYFDLLAIVFTILLIGGFVLIKYMG